MLFVYSVTGRTIMDRWGGGLELVGWDDHGSTCQDEERELRGSDGR